MKTATQLSLIGLLFCCLQGCYIYKNYPPPQLLSAIPPKPSKTAPEMYYPDELVPDRAYVPISILEVKNDGFVNSKQLAAQLATKGQEFGVDAIIGIQKERHSVENISFLGVLATVSSALDDDPYNDDHAYTSYRDVSVLSGIGIVYQENIDYLDRFKKSAHLYQVAPNGTEEFSPSAVIRYDAHGEVLGMEFSTDQSKALYDSVLSRYSIKHLVHEKNNWQYFKEYGQLKRRRLYRLDDWILKTCTFRYGSKYRLEKIRIKYHDQTHDKLALFYDEKGRLSRKTVKQSNGLIWEEQLSYSTSDQLVQSQWVAIQAGKPVPFLRIRYAYYATSDLAELLKQE